MARFPYWYTGRVQQAKKAYRGRAATRGVIGSVLQARVAARKELATLEGVDDSWLERAMRELPDGA